MATLSLKCSTDEKDQFEQWCEDQGKTPSSVLREFVRMALKCRRFEVGDPEVGPPVGWLYMEESDG